MGRKHIRSILFIAIQSMKIIEYVLSEGSIHYNGSFSPFILQDVIIFPLVGYYIENRVPKEMLNKGLILKMTFLSIIAIIISCIMTWYSCTIIGEWQESSYQTFFNNLIIIPTMTVYVAISSLFYHRKINTKICNIIITVGSLTFGVYLLEQIYRDLTKPVYNILSQHIGSYPSAIVWIICAFSLGIMATYVLKKIPGLKQLL